MSKFEDIFSKFKASDVDASDIAETSKIAAFLKRKQAEEIIEEVEEERKVKIWVITLAIIGVVAIGCLIGYCIYKKNRPDYLDDFDDEFDDNEDFFEDEE